jgi:SAM-dependent methyltransferase
MVESRAFYDQQYLDDVYANIKVAEEHPFFAVLQAFIDQYRLENKKCLEVGSGRGAFQDMVIDYTGVDISNVAGQYFYKPFCQASAEYLPFQDECFDGIWSYAVLEHIPTPEQAMEEMLRVLKPGGFIFLSPSWRVPPWRPQGYDVRGYEYLNLRGKMVKSMLTVLNFVWMRGIFWILRRLFREFRWMVCKRPTDLMYFKMEPNFNEFLLPDSDACVSLDNHEAILWFISRNHYVPKSQSAFDRISAHCGPLIVVKTPLQ